MKAATGGGSFDMDFATINAFVSVGETGGFRAAARALGMTSAGVSKAISRLEARLGVTLVARTTRSVRLTPVGQVFHARCKSILLDLELAASDAARGSAVPRGRLVVSASRAFGRTRVVPVVAAFVQRYPEVDVEVRLTDRLVDLVTEGVDLAIRIGHLPDSGLVARPLARTGFVLCGSPDYLAKKGIPAHPGDLLHHDVIGYVTPDTAVRFTHGFLVDGVVDVMSLPSRLVVDDGEAAIVAAIGSAGLAMVNDYLVEGPLADGSLLRVLRDFETPPVPISIVGLRDRNPSFAAQTFMSMLRLRFADGADEDA